VSFFKTNLFALAVALMFFLGVVACETPAAKSDATTPAPAKKEGYQSAAPEIAEYVAKGLPLLLDFGMGYCIPCKKMAPDLAQLHGELAGKVLVRFNDLRREKELAQKYRIRVMPTQVYVDSGGKEVYRHEGYASKADMLAKLKEVRFLP